jgi:hypothetical protein
MKQGVADHHVRWPVPGAGDSLVLPIPPGEWAPPREGVEVDGIAFAPKPELHLTLVGGQLGRELRAAFAESWLAAAVTAALDAQEWRFTRTGRHWLLRKPFVAQGKRKTAHSIVEHVELPAMAPFHRELGRLLGRQLPVPPPHVTLYVAGRKQGIGVATIAQWRAYRMRELERIRSTGVDEP